MWSAQQIAERDGVTREAVLKLARDYAVKHELAVERDGRGRIVALNVVQYDHIRGQFGDASKVQTSRPTVPPPSSAPAAGGSSYDEAQRQAKWFEVEKRRLDVAETRKQLVRRDRYMAAASQASQAIARHIDRLPQEADALAAEVGVDDLHRLRQALKGLALRLRAKVTKTFDELAAEAPANDEDLPAEGTRDELSGGE